MANSISREALHWSAVYADFFPEPMRSVLAAPQGKTPRAQILELEQAAHAVAFGPATLTTEAVTAQAVVVAAAQSAKGRRSHPALDLVRAFPRRNLSSFGELFWLDPGAARDAQKALRALVLLPTPTTFTTFGRGTVRAALEAGFRDLAEVPDAEARARLVAILDTAPAYGHRDDVLLMRDRLLGRTATYFALARLAARTFCPELHAAFRTLAPPGAARILSLAAPQPQARADGRHPWGCPDRSHDVIASALAVRAR